MTVRDRSDDAATSPLAASVGLTDADLLAMYRTVALARAVDERMWILNRAGPDPVRHQRAGPRGRPGGPRLAASPGARLDRAVLPLDRHLPRVRDDAARPDARAVREGVGPVLGRAPDARPLRAPGPPHRVRVVAGRDADPPRGGDRARGEDPGHRPGRGRDHGGGELQPGRRPRGAQLRGDPPAAVRAPRREQRVRDQRAGREGAVGQGRRRARLGLRDARASSWTARTCWRATRPGARRWSGRGPAAGPR